MTQGKPSWAVYYDALHEAEWFRELDPRLSDAALIPFPSTRNSTLPFGTPQKLPEILKYDRPDIILVDADQPVVVIERSEEVPTGHNVGQRFARLAAAAESGIALIYMFPFAAYKHGGDTQGPRYVNLRLFQAMSQLESAHGVIQLPLSWPVDSHYELVMDPTKDGQIKAVISGVLDIYRRTRPQLPPVPEVNAIPAVQQARADVAREMARLLGKNPEYSSPPPSVQIVETERLIRLHNLPQEVRRRLTYSQTVLYKVGMTYVRSDPYTGTAMVYDYIYARDEAGKRIRNVVLHMPSLRVAQWNQAAENPLRKDVRLFLLVSDTLILMDGFILP